MDTLRALIGYPPETLPFGHPYCTLPLMAVVQHFHLTPSINAPSYKAVPLKAP